MAIAQGWMDSRQPFFDQVYQASSLDSGHEHEWLTLALNESVAEFRRPSKRFTASTQKDSAAAEWAVKLVIERFAEQFALLSDSYFLALGQRLLFHLDDSARNIVQWPSRFVLVADELSAALLVGVPHDKLVGCATVPPIPTPRS